MLRNERIVICQGFHRSANCPLHLLISMLIIRRILSLYWTSLVRRLL